MPDIANEIASISSPSRIREWLLLASTMIGLLANMGMHMVFSNSSTTPAQMQQMQIELSERIKSDAEFRTQLQLVEKERAQMHEHQALIDQRLDYLESRHR